ncbi:MAG: alkaline phosphatase family protein [Microthrixaceae bacterium]
MEIDRRAFLRATGVLGTAAALGACTPPTDLDLDGIGREYHPGFVPEGSILDLPASEAPIDHVVILMMENRSFDHYLGWLGRDAGYLERGVRNYGPTFRIDAVSNQQWADPSGALVDTFHLPSDDMPDPWRGCGYEDPGHSWSAGLAQRDRGFLGEGSKNDRFALGYYEADDLPFTSRLARRFTTFDRYHCSLLSSTQSNRRYLHSGQSGGFNNNYIPLKEGGFQFDTIWDRLRSARVPVRSYFSDLPSLAFWGYRLNDMWTPIDQYFTDCRRGALPAVTFIDPPYLPWWQADDHPHADPRAGQRFLRDVFRAFATSPHWQRGLFLLTYDEWGGFYDHVRPPLLPDDLAGPDEAGFDYAQAGFRVPTVMASPYARPGYVDHRTYDHTSIARFLEWRFLGAPPEGPGVGAATWALSSRDRYANNIGASLGASGADPELFDLDDLPMPAPLPANCASTDYIAPLYPTQEASTPSSSVPTTSMLSARAVAPPVQADSPPRGPGADLIDALEAGYFERIGASDEPSEIAGVWADGGSVT